MRLVTNFLLTVVAWTLILAPRAYSLDTEYKTSMYPSSESTASSYSRLFDTYTVIPLQAQRAFKVSMDGTVDSRKFQKTSSVQLDDTAQLPARGVV